MIAYIIRLMTTIFGHNFFGINIFGVVISAMTVYVIIKIGEVLDNHELGVMTAIMWLVFPFSTTRFIFVTLNYDCIDNFFCLTAILFIFYFLRTNKPRYIYLTGIVLGMLLLTKYLGIVLIFGIVTYFLLYERSVFRNKHFYLAAIISLIIFSPVLIWNYQNDWASFHYKLTFHNWDNSQYKVHRDGISGFMFYLCSDVLGVMHILFLILAIIWYKQRKISSKKITDKNIIFLLVICITSFIFWAYESFKSHVAMNYLISMDSIIIILTSHYLYKYNYLKVFKIFIVIFTLMSVAMLVDRAFIKKPEANDIALWTNLPK